MNLVWFKQDLRIYDNPALFNACKATTGVIAIYLITPDFWQAHDDAAIKIEFWRQNLIDLQKNLNELNIPLLVATVSETQSAEKLILKLSKQHAINCVFYNRQYELHESQRETKVAELLQENAIECKAYRDQCIIEPGSLLTKQGKPYSVFTPFKRAWLDIISASKLQPLTKPKKQAEITVKSDKIPKSFKGFNYQLDTKHWPIGETAAHKRLTSFIKEDITGYKQQRDFPALDATSGLSAYLAAGVLSLKQCFIAASNANNGSLARDNQGIAIWISELIWREFYRHIMVAFPKVMRHQPFKEKTKKLRWNNSKELLIAWQQGKTGIPIIDAAMRQLNQTGWMHNRLRMVTAMFLTKNCFIDWREGEKYFMQQLIDGDLASNNGGWQWSASTGTDAAPYFRVMNPVTQSERFDPAGEFIRKYCPELAELDNKSIHNPHQSAPLLMQDIDYPEPIVDLKQSRAEAIAKFKALAS